MPNLNIETQFIHSAHEFYGCYSSSMFGLHQRLEKKQPIVNAVATQITNYFEDIVVLAKYVDCKTIPCQFKCGKASTSADKLLLFYDMEKMACKLCILH